MHTYTSSNLFNDLLNKNHLLLILILINLNELVRCILLIYLIKVHIWVIIKLV